MSSPFPALHGVQALSQVLNVQGNPSCCGVLGCSGLHYIKDCRGHQKNQYLSRQQLW